MLTQERLKEELEYDAATGVFTRLKTHRAVKYGDIAGHPVSGLKHKKEYIRIGVLGQYYYAHRLAFLYMLNRDPLGDVDHINQNSLDNSWGNLRECSHAENGKNQKKYRTNTSGTTGVHLRSSGKWRARIHVRGRPVSLGTFSTQEEAMQARQEAEKEFTFHENHGK